MMTRLLRLPLLALAAAAAVTACTTEAPPQAGGDATQAPVGDPAPDVTPVTDPDAMLEVEDQTSEGPTVLAKAAATDGGFVVVYSEEGRNTLGTGIVEPGTEPQDVQVSLAEELTEETALIARLFADTDDNGLFSDGDQPISNGEDDDSDDTEVFPGEQEEFQFTGKPVVNS